MNKFPKESFLSGSNVELYTDKEKKKFISDLLDCMNSLEKLLNQSGLPDKEVGYGNDLWDAVKVLYLKESPDSSNQFRLRKELRKGTEEPMDFFEAYQSILIRIGNMTESITEVNMTRY